MFEATSTFRLRTVFIFTEKEGILYLPKMVNPILETFSEVEIGKRECCHLQSTG